MTQPPLMLIQDPLSSVRELGIGLLFSAGLTWLLARWACRARGQGLLDAPGGALAARKLQHSAVPAVGGIALLLSLGILEWGLGWFGQWELWLPARVLPVSAPVAWLSLLMMFGVGLWDDLTPTGLGPLQKLLGQAFALLPLALGTVGILLEASPGGEAGLSAALSGLGVLVVGLWAVNVLNTFDNADGALTGLTAAGFVGSGLVAGSLALVLPWNGLGGFALGGICLGFLLHNLNARRSNGGPLAAATPSAYLGDSGAYVLGLLVLLQPIALGVLWIPSLDLLRLSLVRLRAGSRPWIGDRRHLAHRLQRAGLESRAVALILVGLGLPGSLGFLLWYEKPALALLGLGISALGFAGALWLTRAGRAGPGPCP